MRCRAYSAFGLQRLSWGGVLQLQTARDKLQGRHPSDILLAELAPKYSSTAYWTALQVRCLILLRQTSSLL